MSLEIDWKKLLKGGTQGGILSGNGNRKLTHRGNRILTHLMVENKFPDVTSRRFIRRPQDGYFSVIGTCNRFCETIGFSECPV